MLISGPGDRERCAWARKQHGRVHKVQIINCLLRMAALTWVIRRRWSRHWWMMESTGSDQITVFDALRLIDYSVTLHFQRARLLFVLLLLFALLFLLLVFALQNLSQSIVLQIFHLSWSGHAFSGILQRSVLVNLFSNTYLEGYWVTQMTLQYAQNCITILLEFCFTILFQRWIANIRID